MWWLKKTADEASAPIEVRAAWERARGKLGFLPNVQRLYALRPARYLEWLAHYEDVMRGESGLSPLEREMIALVVSDLNDCHYCLTSHAAYLRVLSGDSTLPDRLRAPAHADEPPRIVVVTGDGATMQTSSSRNPASLSQPVPNGQPAQRPAVYPTAVAGASVSRPASQATAGMSPEQVGTIIRAAAESLP